MSEAAAAAAPSSADEDEVVVDEFMDYKEEEQVVEVEDDVDPSAPPSPRKQLSAEELDAMREKAEKESALIEEQRKERQVVLKQVAERAKEGEGTAEQKNVNRLAFLMQQSEVFAHFMTAGQLEQAKGGKKGKGKKAGRKGRLGEEVEDANMLKTADQKVRLTKITEQPKCINHPNKYTMRPYQIEGLNWMVRLHDSGINGVLADEMGLGKTLQTISLLSYLREARGITGPHIIITPKSTLGNWMREFRNWSPQISAVRLSGNKAERQDIIKNKLVFGTFDVIVTSYEITIIEKASLKKLPFKYLVIDEAHRIKNENSKLSQVVRTLNTANRLLITGTPLQNNLHELWALLNFLLPDIFSSSEDFDSWFNMDEKQENVVKKLHTVLRPFMLRRLKNDVEFSLKPKIETKLYIGLTEMQKFWYQKVLTKDVSSLNALGGPDRVRLLNILMQLRKVCNHPYLFDGAEPGPPYIDGPHLWETSGKMVLLDKLLKKLQAQDSRVLIFSQMTRLLDILEDMMKIQGYQYCRIDGSTKGEDRDQYMDDFNAPNSEKFVFLLSTRAGGLGINLATADIVVLFDSDWNPQVDLQAMDRAHRIGQTKQVRVFRFVSEGTVEEKIIERAERKLYLDAAVIQQGRLMEQNTKLSKDELMTMVKFGAEEIFKSKNATITEEDIDALLAKGEERTEAMKEKIKGDMQHNLANFTLGGDEGSLYDFSGALAGDDGGGGHVFLSLPQRERKRNYDVNGYFRDALKSDSSKGKSERGPRQQKGPQMHDFQFFNRARIEELMKKDFEMATQRRTQQNLIKEMRSREKRSSKKEDDDGDAAEAASEADRLEEELEQYELSPEEQSEKEALIAEGFGDWHRRDLKCFLAACERFGRNAKAQIYKSVGEETGKMETSVRAYCKMFWERYQEIADWEKMIEKIEKGEKRIERNQAIEKALRLKVARHKNPWQTLKINYGTNKGKAFTEEEDIFLVCKMNELGYGNWEELKIAIRQAWQFRFDWFIKSRTPLELQRRCETLTRLIEKENEEEENKRKATEKAQKAAKKKSGGSSKKSTKKRPASGASESKKKKGRK